MPTFTGQQRADEANLIIISGESIARITGNPGYRENSLRGWAADSDIDGGKGTPVVK